MHIIPAQLTAAPNKIGLVRSFCSHPPPKLAHELPPLPVLVTKTGRTQVLDQKLIGWQGDRQENKTNIAWFF